MRNADLFVLPSLTETFSVATAEALCAGVPVLVTRCGGPEEFVDEQCGMLVSPGDVQALADGLNSMLNRLNTFDREAISRAAAAKFRHEAVGSKLNGVYHELIAARARTRRGSNRISSRHNRRSWIFGGHLQ
jgi:glycosyltransferase involved in cell wall biosynthesis